MKIASKVCQFFILSLMLLSRLFVLTLCIYFYSEKGNGEVLKFHTNNSPNSPQRLLRLGIAFQ